jgi:hypothetical protein
MNVSESVRITTVLKDALAALKCVAPTRSRVALSRAAPRPPPARRRETRQGASPNGTTSTQRRGLRPR